MIRFAAPADAEALLFIYAQYIDTAVTFEYTLPSVREFRERILHISESYPYLVYERDGEILGYAYAHRYAEREAYQWGAELSVYLDRNMLSRGLGTRLYTALIELLKLQGVRTVYGLVTRPNEKSDRLHAAMGFTDAGATHNAGYKAGKWRDVTTYEKAIAPYDDNPAPPVSIGRADAAQIRSILEKYS